MHDQQRRRFERIVRSADFATSLAEPFAPESRGGKALAELRTSIEELESTDAAVLTNVRSARQGTTSKNEARQALRDQIDAISDTGKTIGMDHPELKEKFRRPRGNANDQTLVSVGRSFAAEATPVKNLFIEYDLPADFIDRLNASLDAFEQSVNQQNAGASASRSSRVSIEATLDRAEQELARLDTAMQNKYRDDAATLSAWKSASRVERSPRKKKETPTPQK
ncbi:MAG TPA: hypothetical protein VF708_02965 [Pyrinomonadaceae bacterium]|jgi:hypothetical protein